MFYLLNELNDSPQAKAQIGLQCARHQQSLLRRENMQIRMDYYKGTQIIHLQNALKTQFKNQDRLRLQYEFANITRMIIDELACLYAEEPSREIVEGTEEDKKIYEEIKETSNIDATMKAVNQYVKLLKTVAVRPVFRDGVLEYDILTPNIFDVIQNPISTTKASAIIYTQATSDTDPTIPKYFGNTGGETYIDMMQATGQLYFYWDAKSHIVFTFDLKKQALIPLIQQQEKNPDNINPYGQIPFVFFRDRVPVDEFFIEGGDDLINANKMLNVKLTELNYLTKMQAFSQPVAKGAPKSMTFLSDPSTLMTLPADDETSKGIDFKFVTPDARIAEMHADIESRLRRIAMIYKLPSEMFSVSGSKSSGFSIEMQNVQLKKAIKGDKPLFRQYEKELFEITKKVWNYHNPGRKFSDTCRLFLDFGEPENPTTQDEKDNHNSILYANGIISRARWAMIENPDIKNIEEAEKYIAKIDEERAKEMQGFSSQMMPPEQENSKDEGATKDNADVTRNSKEDKPA